MPAMTPVEVWACRNPLWRLFTSRVVVPWVFAGHDLAGDVLELGCGAGANAAALLDRFPDVRLTATDVDPAMLGAARTRLARFGDRVSVEPADATGLGFGDGSFDAVASLIMLHHVGDRPAALAEAARVLRPGGRLVGYDLASAFDLRAGLTDAGFVDVRVDTALLGRVARFSGRTRP